MKVLIADDEALSRRGVALRLGTIKGVDIVGECNSAEAVSRFLRQQSADLLILDIEMPRCSGIDLLHKGEHEFPWVIFLTAHARYALQAFEVHALDYLLKPIDESRFTQSVTRARDLIDQGIASRMSDGGSAGARAEPAARFTVRVGTHIEVIPLADVDWIEAVGDYAGLHVGGRLLLVRESMTSLESRVSQFGFIRVHRSAIVRPEQVTKIEHLGNCDCVLTLRNGTIVRASRTFSGRLWEALGTRLNIRSSR